MSSPNMIPAPEIGPANTLLCVFSYNMGASLKICLESTRQFCPNFRVIVCDDNSEDPQTRQVLEDHRGWLDQVIVNTDPKDGKRHGNLYANIRNMLDHACENGFDYLFMIQDDMQFVRPFSPEVRQQYSRMFATSEKVLQVDPRFLRGGEYEIMPDIRAYRHGPETAYADVGVTHLGRLKASGWILQDGEGINREALADMDYQRLFPFSPIMMHVPFPKLFRKGKRKVRIFPFNRGRYSFHAMTETEIAAMDARPFEELPIFRKFLRPRNMRLSRLAYSWRKDTKIFT
ncbi:glycosyltransferase [Terrihabitans sp. B22-R8]|uniref:glycosyltransferase n=1 Tax=Terrihabitans sp. B22-R8 TaxID=3425128 RepID=UPI00403C090A